MGSLQVNSEVKLTYQANGLVEVFNVNGNYRIAVLKPEQVVRATWVTPEVKKFLKGKTK